MFRKYKGCVGSVRSIHSLRDKPFFAAAGLDRFLRIFDIGKQKAVQKMYLKSRLNCVLVSCRPPAIGGQCYDE
jgi:ribosome biogenesis protein NSA1